MKWTEREVKQVLDMHDQGETIKDIARTLNRPYGSVAAVIRRSRSAKNKAVRNRKLKARSQS